MGCAFAYPTVELALEFCVALSGQPDRLLDAQRDWGGAFAFGIAWVLSGFFMPLRFFPDWFQTLCHLTPFPSMVNTTIEIYLGLLTGGALVWALAVQLFWIIVLIAICQLTLRAGVRKLVIQGG